MFEPYLHNIDPIFGRVGGLYLWWYGLGYSLGFLEMFLFLRRHRDRLALAPRDVYSLNLFIVAGVLVGGRFIEVAFDEWPFYREHPGLIPAYWLGGMASHGVMLGAAVSAFAFSFLYEKSLLNLADAIVIPGAFLMGMGRIGNFIDGQIVGAVTDVAWGVQFPDAEGFRHPVVLYDGAKNLLLVPYLLWVRRTNPTPGATTARFRLLVCVSQDLHRPLPRLSDAPARARHRADAQPADGPARHRFLDPLAPAPPGAPGNRVDAHSRPGSAKPARQARQESPENRSCLSASLSRSW